MAESFVNPYTFVPFPDLAPHRSAPHGHLGRGDLLSGRLMVTIDAETPLLIRGITAQRDDTPQLPRRPDGTPMIPGSSLKGALRSLHETLVGGCLRVFNNDFVPGYRDSAKPSDIGTVRMAVVKHHDDETAPPVLLLCKDGDPRKLRLHQKDLLGLHSEDNPLTSGDRLKVSFDAESGKPTGATRSADGEWVVFITDSHARESKSPYRAHIRRLPPEPKTVDVPAEVWRSYVAALEGADDLRTKRVKDHDETERYASVTFDYKPKGGLETTLTLGRRWLVSKRLHPGQPVWVRVQGDQIIALRHAMIWRHNGDYRAEERIDSRFLPCEDEQHLCPSCQVFGSADTSGRDGDHAEQHSYRGHVRFGDALAVGDVAGLEVTLPPMGRPRPGAGQFYLVNDPNTRGNASARPLREWGSIADQDRKPRRLRGRKYYWHTPLGTDSLPARGQARPHQLESAMTSKAVAFPPGTRFTATITFTDLDEIQLGGLLAVLQPSSLLGQRVWQHIGGGRPLGYGSCTVSVDTEHSMLWRSGSRYGAEGTAAQPDIDGIIASFQTWVQSELPAVGNQWPLVAKVLAPNTVDPNKVWYPPGAGWKQQGSKEFDDGYSFWKQTSGAEMARDKKSQRRTGFPLTPLPELCEDDQSMDIIPADKAVPLPQQQRHPLDDDRKGRRK
ncbi:CRISPR-associated protein [Saccharopolyspora kobensis]|uniref:CRISPR-associated protein n=1 Tax=Saccharopolyspora kobensis TaxID=146035 RepID=A0A1H5VSE9_9PSEU|nr:TIGR03986 family CRISPR-associated RAMP protein [Saccharopolyspora kobensis]SEF89898.1 CRISPR-associated protein [Saccharopolyspora kobensis]SFC57793.1 CRISPR-associated protein [Saccharopolyspora kobensis]